MLTQVSCGPRRREQVWAKAAAPPLCTLPSIPLPRPPTPPAPEPGSGVGSHTFEAVCTQALELELAGWHACATVLARLALTRGAAVALLDAPAAQEAVGEVQPLPIHRHLWYRDAEGLWAYQGQRPGCPVEGSWEPKWEYGC